MRKFLFNFVFAFALGAITTLWLLSPGDIKDFISEATREGSVDLEKLQNKADWKLAEDRVLTGAQKTVETVSEWDMFNSIRARNYINKQVN